MTCKPLARSPRVESLESRTLLALVAGFERVEVAEFDTFVATSMAFAPDGRLFALDTSNRQVRVVKDGDLLATPALSFTELEVDRARERGLEGIAFDPNFQTNGFVYLYYTKPDPAAPNVGPSNAVNRLVRYKMSAANGDVIDKSSAVVLLDNVPSPSSTHNGGAMHFGADGMMYLGIGDGGQTAILAQDLNSPNGKVLRLNVSAVGASPNPAAMAPTDNPFYSAADGITVRDYIFAYGFRNPFSGDIRPGTNTLFINDVGNTNWEEVNHVQAGKNYGWPGAEGTSSNPAFVNPIHAYTHYPNGEDQPRLSSSITGGAFYTGNHFPTQYSGKYFFGDYVREFIKVLDPVTGQVSDFHTNAGSVGTLDVVDIDLAPDGTLWTLSVDGNIHRYRYVGSGNRAPSANATANVTNGATPLVVNFSGAGSVDPDNDPLTYAWDFGDGTTGSGRNVQKTYANAGKFIVRLTVTDDQGASAEADPITVIAGSLAPTATILTPVVGQAFRAGRAIGFSATASDPEDGTLPASAFEWSVVFHHSTHTHPFIDSIPGVTSGSFVVPRIGEQDPDQWYRIHLTVTDSDGVKHSIFRDVHPKLTTIQLATNVPGLELTLDGSPQATPGEVQGVEGMIRALGAPATQTVDGRTFEFVGWSDGGAATHDIAIPIDYETYVARYRQTGGPVETVVPVRFDSFVRDGAKSGVNYGAEESLVAMTSGRVGNTRHAHVKFDLAGAALAANQRVILRMWARLSDTAADDVPVGVYPVADTSWGERSITWDNAPAAGPTPLDVRTIGGTHLEMYEWDVTDYVLSEVAAGRTGLAFALKQLGMTGTQVWFSSAEAPSYGPGLVITPPAVAVPTNVASYVRWGSFAAQNFGNDANLLVKLSTVEESIRETFMKFDLSAVSSIASAKLRLFGRLSSAGLGGVTIGAWSAPDTSWTEGGITFNNRPLTTPGLPLSTATVKGTDATWYEWDLTSFLQAEKAAGRNVVTIALKATTITDPWAQFNSDDAATNRPHLLIT